MFNLNIPDGLPILGQGAHSSPATGACVMEYVSLLAGERWTDTPECSDEELSFLAQFVNDVLSDEDRQGLLAFIPRLIDTAIHEQGEEFRLLVWRDLADWAIRQQWANLPFYSEVRNGLSWELGGAPEAAISSYARALRYVVQVRENKDDWFVIDGPGTLARFSALLDEWDRLTGQTAYPDCDLVALEAERQALIAEHYAERGA